MILIERGKPADRDDIYINMQEERVDRDGGPEASSCYLSSSFHMKIEFWSSTSRSSPKDGRKGLGRYPGGIEKEMKGTGTADQS
ncbi:hypothetical protein U1Q18_018379 [Sarracenia purpurea var. burkii]